MVNCAPLNATFLHQSSCDANQTVAEQTANLILTWPHSRRLRTAAPAPSEAALSRLIACGSCPACAAAKRERLAAAEKELFVLCKRALSIAENSPERSFRS